MPAVEAPISEGRDNQQLLSVLHDRHRPDVAQLRSIVAATLSEAFARYHQRALRIGPWGRADARSLDLAREPSGPQ